MGTVKKTYKIKQENLVKLSKYIKKNGFERPEDIRIKPIQL